MEHKATQAAGSLTGNQISSSNFLSFFLNTSIQRFSFMIEFVLQDATGPELSLGKKVCLWQIPLLYSHFSHNSCPPSILPPSPNTIKLKQSNQCIYVKVLVTLYMILSRKICITKKNKSLKVNYLVWWEGIWEWKMIWSVPQIIP